MVMAYLRRHGTVEWILLEAGFALLLAVFIVWFTAGGKRKRPPEVTQPAPDGKANPDQER